MFWTPSIAIGGLNVLSSGTLVSSGDDAIEIVPVQGAKDSFTVRVEFQTDLSSEVGWTRLEFRQSGPSIVCYNFGERGGSGIPDPYEIGNLDGKSILFILASTVYGVGVTKTRITHYTFVLR